MKIGENEDALGDADACIRLRPEWKKAYYRKGSALMSLKVRLNQNLLVFLYFCISHLLVDHLLLACF